MDRVRADYLEMPDLALTKWQMQRFWMVDEDICDALIRSLIASDFLYLRADHKYARLGHSV
jgi:uncharacterized membrane protein